MTSNVRPNPGRTLTLGADVRADVAAGRTLGGRRPPVVTSYLIRGRFERPPNVRLTSAQAGRGLLERTSAPRPRSFRSGADVRRLVSPTLRTRFAGPRLLRSTPHPKGSDSFGRTTAALRGILDYGRPPDRRSGTPLVKVFTEAGHVVLTPISALRIGGRR